MLKTLNCSQIVNIVVGNLLFALALLMLFRTPKRSCGVLSEAYLRTFPVFAELGRAFVSAA